MRGVSSVAALCVVNLARGIRIFKSGKIVIFFVMYVMLHYFTFHLQAENFNVYG